MNQKIKVLGLASAIMMSIGSLSFAVENDLSAEDATFFSNYPNLTSYNTEYTFIYDKDSGDKSQILKVQAASPNWSPKLFDTITQANSISWNKIVGTSNAVTSVNKVNVTPDDIEGSGGFSAKANTTIDTSAEAGVTIVEATNGTYGGYMDFTVVINPIDAQTQSGINVRAYDKTSGSFEFLASGTNTVNSTTVSSNINYASAMDALGVIGTDISAPISYGTPYLTSVTINDIPYIAQGSSGWMYAVYNVDGTLSSISNKVGAETFNVSEGQTVVWAYVNGYDAGFPNTLSELPSSTN